MTNPGPTTTTAERPSPDRPIVCPFCALTCDDLSLPAHTGDDKPPCDRARRGFDSAIDHGGRLPTVDGRETDWDSALGAARQLLTSSRLPLFHGLLGDLGDARAAWGMAAVFRGVVDHRDGDDMARRLTVFQDSGWITTSMGEMRNRADLLVWVGTPTHTELPRLQDRLFKATPGLHRVGTPEIVELGDSPLAVLDQTRVILAERPLRKVDPLARHLLERLRESAYPVLMLGQLATTRAELVLRAASALVRDLNETQRAALLLLGTGSGDVTTQLSGAWHNGFGIRTSHAAGFPEQDLVRFRAQRLLDEGQADLLVWISSLVEAPPPTTRQPQLVFGHPAMDFDGPPPAVFLPVAVPGIHRDGFIHRGDGLCLMPLRGLVPSDLPSTADLARRLMAGDALPEDV